MQRPNLAFVPSLIFKTALLPDVQRHDTDVGGEIGAMDYSNAGRFDVWLSFREGKVLKIHPGRKA